MEALSRRKFATIAAVAAAAVTASVAANASEETPEVTADGLYREYVALMPECRRLHDQLQDTLAQIKRRRGPNHLDLRATFDEAMRDGVGHTYKGGLITRKNALRWYRKELRKLAHRLKAERAEEARVYLDAKSISLSRHLDKMFDIRQAIWKLPPSFNSITALVLSDAKMHAADREVLVLQDFPFKHVRPALSGLIAEHVDVWLSAIDSDRRPRPTLSEMPFYG
jgi:hypothetical protein